MAAKQIKIKREQNAPFLFQSFNRTVLRDIS